MQIIHVTTVHSRKDIRIYRKECVSLAEVFGSVTLIVGDGLGDAAEGAVRVLDVGAASKRRFWRILAQPVRVFLRVRLDRSDVVHVHDPELLPIALIWSWLGKRVVYDAHEDVPRQILAKPWIPGRLRGIISRAFELFEDFVARRLSGVVTATPHIANRFRRVNQNTQDINNFPLPSELAPSAEASVRTRRICYVGGITRIRGIGPLIEALPLVSEVRLILCGAFSDAEFQREMQSLPGWSRVDYLGHVSRGELQRIMGECSAGIVTFLPLPNHVDAQPNKMFEYMSAGLPVVASDFPLWREIIVNAGAGLCVDPNSPVDIAQAIERILSDSVVAESMGNSGRASVVERYNWPTEAVKLVNFYKGLK